MGLFSFASSVGRKLGVFGEKTEDPAIARAKEAAAAAKSAADEGARLGLQARAIEADISAAINSHGLAVAALAVRFNQGTVTLTGSAATAADAEKAILVAGNTEGVSTVDSQLAFPPEPPAVFHTVNKGDTLSLIAREYYGVMRLFDPVFDANKPMLTHPDLIYPGQVLRIPPVAPPIHTVAKGETLGTIAKHWYGDAKRFTHIFEANRGSLANPDSVAVGQQLTIPLIDPKVGAFNTVA